MNEKTLARTRILQARDSLSPHCRAQKSQEISSLLSKALTEHFAHTQQKNPTVAVYSSMKSEVDLSSFISFAYECGWKVCFPFMLEQVSSPRAQMTFYEIPLSSYLARTNALLGNPLKRFHHNELEATECLRMDPFSLDAVILPLVAYNNHGHRLGYGGGNYDRFLPSLRSGVYIAGVAFKEQYAEAIPLEPHDCPLPCIITA